MSSTPREIGTLIAVILKAKNLPNKRHIGKQAPYCSMTLNGEKRRTKAIRRGGQHPEWDEEVRFTLYEDVEDELARTANGDDTPPPPPPKSSKGPKMIKGGKVMRLYCYADDPKEPDLIGETTVDLTEVLTKGETDEWFTLMNKDKYCGEVYLELTFWSNEAPPEKKVASRPAKKQYGGAGSFVPLEELPSSLLSGPGGHTATSRVASNSSLHDGYSHDSIPSSLRTSSSIAQLDLYVPPYEQNRNRVSPVDFDRVTNDFGELNVSGLRRRESFPPPHGGYTPRPSSSTGFSTLPSHPSHGFDQTTYSDGGSTFTYDRPTTPTASSPHRNTVSGPSPTYPLQPGYQSQYDNTPSGFTTGQSTVRHRPRYSVPTSSSGFVPIPTPAPSGFSHFPSHVSEPSGFLPPVGHTPAPMGYSSHIPSQPGYTPVPAQTPAPSGFMPPIPPSSAGFHQHLSQLQPYEYPPYAPPPSSSAPPQQYMQPAVSVPPPSHSAPPQHYPGYAPATPPQQYLPSSSAATPPQPYHSYDPATPPQQYQHASSAPPQPYQGYAPTTPSPPHDHIPPPPPIQSNSNPSIHSTGSRPLPQQPSGPSQQQLPPFPPSGSGLQQAGSYNSNHPGNIPFPSANPYNSIPPPPPVLPPASQPHRHSSSPHAYSPSHQLPNGGSLPPPPPPPSQFQSTSLSGRPSLPLPPQHAYQPVPPPPPPDLSQQHPPPPPPPHMMSQSQLVHPGPPPRPPTQNEQPPWYPPQPQGGYPQATTQGGWN